MTYIAITWQSRITSEDREFMYDVSPWMTYIKMVIQRNNRIVKENKEKKCTA